MKSKVWNYPLFKHWYKALDWIMDKTAKMPRALRPTLVKRIDDLAMDIMEHIVEAIFSTAKQRRFIFKTINLKLDKLRIYFRICFDRKYISTNQYQYVSEMIDETGKMIGGWMKTL